MMGNFIDSLFKNSVDGCVVTGKYGAENAGFTIVAKDNGRRYAIINIDLYQRIKMYCHADYTWFDDEVARRLVEKQQFNE